MPPSEPQASGPSILFVCDDFARGSRLAAAVGASGAKVLDLEPAEPWERELAELFVFWLAIPEVVPLRRALRRVPAGARSIVVTLPHRSDIVELALRENAIVLTFDGREARLAEELLECLRQPSPRAPGTEEARLARALTLELTRRLRKAGTEGGDVLPRLQRRIQDDVVLRRMVERIATEVLEESRDGSSVGIAGLDWETMKTAVRARQAVPDVEERPTVKDAPALETVPDFPSVELTTPIPLSSEIPIDVELIAFVESLDVPPISGEVPVAAVSSIPPPLPTTDRPRPNAPRPTTPPPPWLWGVAGVSAAAALCLLVAVAFKLAWREAPSAPSMATAPAIEMRAEVEARAEPAATEASEPDSAPSAAVGAVASGTTSEAPAASGSHEPPAEAAAADGAPTPLDPAREALRSAQRARRYQRTGRVRQGLAAARTAVELAPNNREYRVLLTELRRELASRVQTQAVQQVSHPVVSEPAPSPTRQPAADAASGRAEVTDQPASPTSPLPPSPYAGSDPNPASSPPAEAPAAPSRAAPSGPSESPSAAPAPPAPPPAAPPEAPAPPISEP